MDRTAAVTGGSGKLGHAAVRSAHPGGVDRDQLRPRPSSDSRAHFVRTDLTDYCHVVETLSTSTKFTVVSTPSSIWLPSRRGFRPQRRHGRNQPDIYLPRLPGRKAVQIHNLVWAFSETLLGVTHFVTQARFDPCACKGAASPVRRFGRRLSILIWTILDVSSGGTVAVLHCCTRPLPIPIRLPDRRSQNVRTHF
jgi:hypothetical protein